MNPPLFPSHELLQQCKILVVGDVMLDRYWYGDVHRISPEAPVPVVHIQSVENRLGGAANVALNVRSLGAQVTLLSTVGKDDAARCLHDLLERHGINAKLDENPSMETIIKLRVIGRAQQMMRIDFEKAPEHEVSAGMLERFTALLTQHDVVLFSDYGKGRLVHIPHMIQLARSAGKTVLVDPKGDDWSRYSGADIVTPNRAELAHAAGHWTNEEQLHEKAQALCRQLNLHALLLTRSEKGMTLFESNRTSSIPANAREVADVTGAGDTVIATMALMVGCGLNVVQAMEVANRAAGLVVAKFGTASLTYEELCQL